MRRTARIPVQRSVSDASHFGGSALGGEARDGTDSSCRHADDFVERKYRYTIRSYQGENVLSYLPRVFIEGYKFNFDTREQIQSVFLTSIEASAFLDCKTRRKTHIR